MHPEKNDAVRSKYESKTESDKDNKSPSFAEIIGVFKILDVWKIIIFIIISWTFYTVFDQQMFPHFFTQFFATPEEGQQAYGVLNSVQVFLEFLMMGVVPVVMKKIGVSKVILLPAPETALFILGIFRYFTLHFDTRMSATIYMVGFQIAAQVGQIIFSTPLGALHDDIGYQSTFLVISGIVMVASIYAFAILRKLKF